MSCACHEVQDETRSAKRARREQLENSKETHDRLRVRGKSQSVRLVRDVGERAGRTLPWPSFLKISGAM